MIVLSHSQRHALLNASTSGIEELQRVLAFLRSENPKAFHTPHTLQTREFYDEPTRGEPHQGFVRLTTAPRPKASRSTSRVSTDKV